MNNNSVTNKLAEVAQRIYELRSIYGFTDEEMAQKTGVTLEEYRAFLDGSDDMPFTFVHKCALAFGVEITDLLEGQSAKLSTYNVTRRGEGRTTANEEGILIQNLAPKFKKKLANPYWVKYEYSSELQSKPIEVTTHSGQEFDLVIKGSLKVQIGDNIEVLHEGDSIYYKSSIPHGMIAVDGEDCLFLAMVMAEDEKVADEHMSSVNVGKAPVEEKLIVDKFITTTVDENGICNSIKFTDEDKFNFAFDVVDESEGNIPISLQCSILQTILQNAVLHSRILKKHHHRLQTTLNPWESKKVIEYFLYLRETTSSGLQFSVFISSVQLQFPQQISL